MSIKNLCFLNYLKFFSIISMRITVFIEIYTIELSNLNEHVIHISNKIKGYLKHFDTEDKHKINNRCAYINYKLNFEIQKPRYRAKSYTFDMIKKYIMSDDYINNTCASNIMYLEENIYNNMKKLYDLYDNYEFIYEYDRSGMDTHNCTELKNLVKEFNAVILSNEKTTNKLFFDKLKYFKCLLENLELIKQKKCAGIEELSSPYMDSKEDIVQCIDQEKEKARPEDREESLRGTRDAEERRAEMDTPDTHMPRAGMTLPVSGNKIRHLIKGKSSISKNMHDEKYKLYVNNFENENNDLEGRRYNVSYYSVDNS
ncbi:hypothetical protein PVIIG_05615 [Plasmodium vivax India VII]|uniref:Variable surface protein n=1 Tax=Plasmodium vivax India VII TaxID=1077284 RepID=A0A0J9S507_PLAVI|nr:hypothetical protein PVIIG_05615 [Plasmodium vivax India VII]